MQVNQSQPIRNDFAAFKEGNGGNEANIKETAPHNRLDPNPLNLTNHDQQEKLVAVRFLGLNALDFSNYLQ